MEKPAFKVLVSTPSGEFIATDEYRSNRQINGFVHARKLTLPRAEFALKLVERWGMVMAEVDGEDSAGRAKLRTLTADEVVSRAVAAADAVYAEIERRGWMVDLPSYADVQSALDPQT